MLSCCVVGRRTSILVKRISHNSNSKSMLFPFHYWPHSVVAKIRNVKTWKDLAWDLAYGLLFNKY